MATASLVTPAAAPEWAQSPLGIDVDAAIEIFDIPNGRKVHGNSFPLGLRVKEGSSFEDVDSAARSIEALTDGGTFNSLLIHRKQHNRLSHDSFHAIV